MSPIASRTRQSIGERLNTFIKCILIKLRETWNEQTGHKDALVSVTTTHLICVSATLGGIIIGVGTVVFSKWVVELLLFNHSRYEGWSLFESYYYCFITCKQ